LIAALVVVFVVSGAAGLIYESIWSRYLGLFVGHSAYAQIIVLVIFLGGMSLGAHLASRWSSRWRSPLLWYAGIEFVVGLLAAVFHDVFLASTSWAYESS
jgi:spermidine synthase